jgi:WD40 repeat protein
MSEHSGTSTCGGGGAPPSTRRPAGARDGWVAAAFSSDGTRLLTGELLCDAHDGRLVARLDLDGPRYLEGGPPEDGRRLADGRYVEMAPLRGVCVYDTANGQRIVRDQRRRYGASDDVMISPDGRSYVHARSSWDDKAAAVWTLRVVDDGEMLAALGPGDRHCVAFAPDGRRLYAASDGGLAVWSVPDGVRLRALPHPAAVTGVAVSRDSSRVLTGASDRMLRVWDCESGELLSERPFAADEPLESSRRSQHGETRTWRASPVALARLDGWCGFSVADHPLVARRRAGVCEIGDRVLARVVTDLELVGDRTGARWACRTQHVEIADDRGQHVCAPVE